MNINIKNTGIITKNKSKKKTNVVIKKTKEKKYKKKKINKKRIYKNDKRMNKNKKKSGKTLKTEPKSTKEKKYIKKKIPQIVRFLCWYKYIGERSIGNCYCCKITHIYIHTFEAGHIIAERFGGKANLINLRPICCGCNRSIGTRNMKDFIKEYGFNNKIKIKK